MRTTNKSRPSAIARTALLLLLCAAAAGCIPTSTRGSHSFRPRIPENIADDFEFKIRKIRVVNESDLRADRSASAADRLLLRFDPRHVDHQDGLDLYISYTEKRLPARIIPDMIPYGFPLQFPLMGLVLPTVETARYDVSASVDVLNRRNDIVHEFDVEFRAYRKSQRGGLFAVVFVMLFPVRGDFAYGSRLPPFHRMEAASRLITNELAGSAASAKLKRAYERNRALRLEEEEDEAAED